ncbi:MAG: alpha/beta hydrolase, partial [Solirubrobacterales bacterium]
MDLEFDVDGERCAAWLYRPPLGQEAPAVVMAHGLSGTRRDRLGPFAERFAAAGLAALVFDHRGFGDSGGEPDRFEPARQLRDWRAAIARARSLTGIDAERVATFGSSIGGGNA